jgi:ABC-type multidrug transport system fused ATPase/permease subunit
VFEILEMRPEIADPVEPETLATPVGGRVEFEDVSFRYTQGEETWTLEDVTLRVAPGEVVALVGPSGGGKTTLVSLLSRFWDVDRGHVRLDGHDVRAIRLADLRGSIGIVPQEPALFSGSVRENIAYARPGASAAEVEAAARAAHAHEFIERLPHGYDTPVGERGVKLSGGQRQRLSIARALLADPEILILDEATSALDTESEQMIQASLDELLRDRTTFIIAHRLSTITHADQIVVLEAGRIVEKGNHHELLRLSGRYAQMVARQKQRSFTDDDAIGEEEETGS